MKVIISLFLFSLVLISGCTAPAEIVNGNSENDAQINQEVDDGQSATNDNPVDDPIQPNEDPIDDPVAPPEEEIIDDPADPISDQPPEEPVDDTPTEEPPPEPEPAPEPEPELTPEPEPEPPVEDPPAEPPVEEPGGFTVNRTSTGYSPSALTISVGDTVTFTNTFMIMKLKLRHLKF